MLYVYRYVLCVYKQREQKQLQALNINGSGPNSEWIRVDTHNREREENTVPGAPTSIRPHAESQSIAISWTPPLDDGIMVGGFMQNYTIFNNNYRYAVI
jgi:neogenin